MMQEKTNDEMVITFDEICESQLFEHSQKFIMYEDYINTLALTKGQFDIVKMDRDRLLEALRVIAIGLHDPKTVAVEALKKSVAREEKLS